MYNVHRLSMYMELNLPTFFWRADVEATMDVYIA